MVFPKFGDVYYANLQAENSSIQFGVRPVLIAQNDTGNKYAPTVTIIPFTGKHKAVYMPTHIVIDNYIECGLFYSSILMVEQIRTISKDQLICRIGSLPKEYYPAIGQALNTQCPFQCAIP